MVKVVTLFSTQH